MRVPTVPITAAATPAAAGRPRQPGGRGLALGAGDPDERSAAAGSPYTRAASAPSTARGRSTTSSGTSGGAVGALGSVSTATAPAATASAANVDAVGAGARQGGVQVARQDPLRAQRDAGDRRRQVAAARAPGARRQPAHEVGSGVRRSGRVAPGRSSLTRSRLSAREAYAARSPLDGEGGPGAGRRDGVAASA